jgi:hypothetical protein
MDGGRAKSGQLGHILGSSAGDSGYDMGHVGLSLSVCAASFDLLAITWDWRQS